MIVAPRRRGLVEEKPKTPRHAKALCRQHRHALVSLGRSLSTRAPGASAGTYSWRFLASQFLAVISGGGAVGSAFAYWGRQMAQCQPKDRTFSPCTVRVNMLWPVARPRVEDRGNRQTLPPGGRRTILTAMHSSVTLTLNGEQRVFEGPADGPLSVSGLLVTLSLDTKKVAVERNEEIVPRSRYAETWLASGDSLEIVHFIGGG
jgi:sulfur carrier protein